MSLKKVHVDDMTFGGETQVQHWQRQLINCKEGNEQEWSWYIVVQSQEQKSWLGGIYKFPQKEAEDRC